MAAPKGNKNAVGNSGNTKKYDLTKEAAELQAWSRKPDSISLVQFVWDKPYCAQSLSVFAKENIDFGEALIAAKQRIGYNREKQCSAGKMHQACWNRSAALYDKGLNDFENEEKDRDAARRAATPTQLNVSLSDLEALAKCGKLKQQ